MQISHKAQSGQTTGEFMRIMPFYIIILPKIRKKKNPQVTAGWLMLQCI